MSQRGVLSASEPTHSYQGHHVTRPRLGALQQFFVPTYFGARDAQQILTEVDMAMLRQLSVRWVRALIGGLALIVFSGISLPLAGQAVAQSGAELMAKSDFGSVALPDAPMPAAALTGRDNVFSAR